MSASSGLFSSSGPSTTSHYHSFNLPLRTKDTSLGSTSDEEWEYEYSQTETEDYYLTLDLTTPLIPSKRPFVPRGVRGTYKAKWIDRGLVRKKRNADRPTTFTLEKETQAVGTQDTAPMTPAPDNDNDNEDAELDADEDFEMGEADADADDDADDDGQANVGAMAEDDIAGNDDSMAANGEAESGKKLEDVQILDLHSENPMVWYRGRIFSCSWAENIGTEMLFTKHDAENPLPALRTLHDIDLLATSSARLISTPVELVPRKKRKDKFRPARPTSQRKALQYIRLDENASEARKEQAHFLEKLMDLKIKKGEKDEVTIIAERRTTNQEWLEIAADTRKIERDNLRLTIRTGSRQAAEAAQKRLDELDAQEREIADAAATAKKKRKGGPAAVDGFKPGKRRRRRRRMQAVAANAAHSARPLSPISAMRTPAPEWHVPQRALSTPTPNSWADLEADEENFDDDDDDI